MIDGAPVFLLFDPFAWPRGVTFCVKWECSREGGDEMRGNCDDLVGVVLQGAVECSALRDVRGAAATQAPNH
ncbi:hypothetical protein BEL01nite_72170 [Bradyrhizobium elkanii]|jgi:hypothetical protein|nr:hypothetical protein BEL01nite_72170 [Bradyrhizobium elkanii]